MATPPPLEEEAFGIGDDEMPLDLPEPPLEDNELPREGAVALRFLGYDFQRHYNLLWTSEQEFAYITGHTICFVNAGTGERRYLHGRDNGGIGAIALSPDRAHFAVAERSTSGPPSVYIYAFKTMTLYRVLRKGTERGYASVKFSPHNKSHLASLGCAPDFLLCVWDWRNERLLLKCKAYGQDVFDIRWGQFPGMLTSVGTGHIRFWKMALTFTGLKLQGDIGKFGATELSDIVGFVELPDGKVVTGTEYGRLLLWEGVFVKVELMRGEEDNPRKIVSLPHERSIEVIMLLKEENCVVTGGDDGFLRWWPIEDIDEAEADYDKGILEYGITMRKEVRIPPQTEAFDKYRPAHIHHVAVSPRDGEDQMWLIQDNRNGVIWRFDPSSGHCQTVMQTHSGPVTGCMVSQPYPGLMISTGSDGTLRAFNIGRERDQELFSDRRAVGISCMAPTPLAIDPERRTLCCGYEDGTLRTFSTCRDGFVMIQCVKPHNCRVKQIAYSGEGSFLASLGQDNTLFFFEVKNLEDHAIPLGFVHIPSQVNHFAWNDETCRVLLGLEDGTLVELTKPVVEDIDNSESFHVELDYRCVLPELPEPVESDEEEEEEEGAEEGAEGQEGEAPAEASMEMLDAPAEKKKKKKKEEPPPKKEEDDDDQPKQVIASTISCVGYLHTGKEDQVLFVGTGTYSGALWELSLDAAPIVTKGQAPLREKVPVSAMAILHTKLPKGVLVTHMSTSPSARFLFLGFVDGRVWAIPLINFQTYSVINVADSMAGPIASICADNDETMLIIGGGDGSLTTLVFNGEELHETAARVITERDFAIQDAVTQIRETMPGLPNVSSDEWELPDLESPGFTIFARDIVDPNHYSIQDAKLKTEEDHAKAQAEQKKKRIRERIAEVRGELEALQDKNSQIPRNRLSDTEMTIDQEHIAFLSRDMENKIEEVRFELAWWVEYYERGMQKLKDHFLSRLDFERVEVLGFRSDHRVATFRCPSMSPQLQTSLAKLHELIFAADQESDDEDGGAELGGSMRGRTGTDFNNSQGMKGTLRMDTEAGQSGHGGTALATTGPPAISGAEQREIRRKQRAERRLAMQELEKAMPSDTYEDPQDVEAIAHAEATMGNYMLKTSDSYQVPENQRMNAEKKRRQMFLLEESMHAIKTEFNHRVLALRDFRQQVRAEVQRDLAALQEIDQQLGTATPWVAGLLDEIPGAPPEFPERRFEITEADLKAFHKKLREERGEKDPEEVPEEAEEEGEEGAEGEENEDGEGEEDREGRGGEEGEEEDDTASLQGDRPPGEGKARRRKKREAKGEGAGARAGAPVAGRTALAARRIARLTLRSKLLQELGAQAGALGKAVAEEAQARLWHDKAQLEEHIRQVIETFNNAVASIEKEKAKLESDLKNADMKLLVLYEELLTLNELEEKDEALLKKATKCRQDKTSIMHQIKECQDQLGEKKSEIEQWHSEEQNLQSEFMELVGENSPFLGALLKIYKKKVKRSKRKKGIGEDEEFDEDEEEEEEESEMEDEDDDDEMEDEVGPPPGCDVQIYESVIDLREKRLDMEDALQDIQKAVEELKKTHKRLLDEEKRIDKEQRQTDSEIQQFQTDKQRKLNQVQIVFALRLSQVQCLGGGGDGGDAAALEEKLPEELSRHVVFTHEGLSRLMSRITELHHEIRDVKNQHKQLQRDFRVRKKEKNTAMQNIEDLRAKFQDIQMLKFGQTVDLDLIERSAPNKYVQELQEKVSEAEAEQRRRLAEWDKRMEKQRKELARLTCENTSLMEQIVSMGYSQMQLDAALNARIANVTVNDTEPLIELREMERERLKDLLALQTKEIATLQAEINLFRKKGGHIYTTVTANRAAVR